MPPLFIWVSQIQPRVSSEETEMMGKQAELGGMWWQPLEAERREEKIPLSEATQLVVICSSSLRNLAQ